MVHPLAEAAVDAAAVRERVAEEVDAEAAFERLYAVEVESPEFADELAAVRDAVIAHALAEEEQEFLALRDAADAERLTRLVAVVAAAPALAATLRTGPPGHGVRHCWRTSTSARR